MSFHLLFSAGVQDGQCTAPGASVVLRRGDERTEQWRQHTAACLCRREPGQCNDNWVGANLMPVSEFVWNSSFFLN